MHANLIKFIPEDPFFTPQEESQKEAKKYLNNAISEVKAIQSVTLDEVLFHDGGTKVKNVRCPHCDTPISEQWWHSKFKEGSFMTVFPLSCCKNTTDLQSLNYTFNQGFSKYYLEVASKEEHRLKKETIRNVEKILGTTLRVIYESITV